MKTKRLGHSAVMAVLFFMLGAGMAQAYSSNTFLGDFAGDINSTGIDNTFIGASAGSVNRTGSDNTAVGSGAGGMGSFGVEGECNTYVGSNAGGEDQGSHNTYVGYNAGYNSYHSANYNTFIGDSAGYSITTGQDNTYIGYDSGHYAMGGSNNAALGHAAGLSNSDGGYDVFIGESAGYYNHGSWNTFVGALAGQNNYTGNANVFIGHNAGSSETGSNKLYIDNCYLTDGSSNCTRPLIKGTFDNPRTVDIDGTLTVAGPIMASLGIHFYDGTTQERGLAGLSTATHSFFGLGAGSNTSGSQDTFVGSYAGYMNTAGGSNSFVGYYAGFSNTSGYGNAFFGNSAGQNNGTGWFNTFLGHQTGMSHTTGDNNTFLGSGAGGNNTTGSGNVFLGYGAGYNEPGSNKLYIANSTTSSPLIWGDFSQGIVKINGTLYMTSDGRLKKNIEPLKSSLDKVMHLQGVSYEWKADENSGRGFKGGREIGLIAQNVEAVIPELVHTDSQGYKSLAYDKMVPVLIEAIREQQKEIIEKDARIEKLEKTLEAIEKRLAAIENSRNTVAFIRREN